MAQPSFKARYDKFRDSTVINKSTQYSNWTLPYLMADVLVHGKHGRVLLERDFQELGALFVNNLAAKLTQLLFPTQYPFFQASANASFLEFARSKGYDEDTVRATFARLEMAANKRLFINSGYASLIIALKHLIVTGNVLLYRDSAKGVVTAYGVQNFSVKRDGSGNLLDCVLMESTTVEGLPFDVQAALRLSASNKYSRPEQTVQKFTRIHRVPRNGKTGYEVSQEIDTLPIGTPSWYPENTCPFMCPTWVLIAGEHYGRGMVEDYAGGFARLSSLSEAAALYGIEIMRVVHLVGAGSGGDIDDLAGSESGEWVRGDPNNITAHEAGDANKLEVVEKSIERVVMRLAKAFMYQGTTRQAERVTAYELQKDAQEAEYALGGVYSTLSGGIQIPLAHLLLTEVSDVAEAGLITGEITPDVTAGIPALGRSSDVQNLLMAAQEINAVIPIATMDERLNPKRIVDIILAGRSIDQTSVFYTPAEQKANADAKLAQDQANTALQAADALKNSGEQLQQTLQGG